MANTPTRSHTYRGRTIHPCAYVGSRNWHIETKQGDLVWDERHSPQFDTLAEAKRHIDETEPPPADDPVISDALQTGIVLKRIAEIGQREVARRVAPLWGWRLISAEQRVSRYVLGRSDMSSAAFLAMLDVLGLTIAAKASSQ